jgi:hypothetical protein
MMIKHGIFDFLTVLLGYPIIHGYPMKNRARYAWYQWQIQRSTKKHPVVGDIGGIGNNKSHGNPAV